MSMMKTKKLVYNDGRTKQSFKNSTDINRILAKAQKTGVISHLTKYGAMYGDFSDMPDLLVANQRLAKGQRIFDDLPSEIRAEFNQSSGEFFKFANDPANKDDLIAKLPALAEPGRQHRILDPTVQAGILEAFEAIAAAGGESGDSEPGAAPDGSGGGT